MAKITEFDVDDPRYRITPSQQMLCSCLGALTTSTLVTPLDVVKIRLQAQQKPMLPNRCFIYCNGLMDHCIICVNGQGKQLNASIAKEQWYRRPGQFTGTLDAFVKIVKVEGISSLWSGLSPTLVLALPATMVYFTMYEQLRCFIKDRQDVEGSFFHQQPVWLTSLVAGGVGRTLAVTMVSPLELIRTKMQSQKLSYQEVGVAVRELVKNRGFFGLWQGLSPSLLRDVPFSAIYWSFYETYKKFLPSPDITISQSFVGGALAGMLAAVVTLPFDVVKTLRQLEFGESIRSDEPPRKVSTTKEIIQRIYQQRGVGGLFAGLVPRIAKIAPACAVMISSYEYGKHYFSRYNKKMLENT
ncbi:solute carrier family 25 member 40-like [Daphnia pulex]|uniref:solute carrier family 25 member 40-like n=1 Tax=Daphnia pulex TaxID=6669 RepID=UPI001EDE217A|nr:solute carrier family 25 member 40-like [Daphnia pulex]XP_046654236.1 solute carrier family 25 member 40-like [Daphnia pulicaria]